MCKELANKSKGCLNLGVVASGCERVFVFLCFYEVNMVLWPRSHRTILKHFLNDVNITWNVVHIPLIKFLLFWLRPSNLGLKLSVLCLNFFFYRWFLLCVLLCIILCHCWTPLKTVNHLLAQPCLTFLSWQINSRSPTVSPQNRVANAQVGTMANVADCSDNVTLSQVWPMHWYRCLSNRLCLTVSNLVAETFGSYIN